MLVSDVMNRAPVTIAPTATLSETATLLSQTRVSDLCVVDEDGRFVGLACEGDVLRALMPRFDEVVTAGGSTDHAFDLFEANGRFLADQPVSRVVLDPIRLAPSDPVLKAATVMVAKHIRLLAVLDGDRLVGTLTRADICTGALAQLS